MSYQPYSIIRDKTYLVEQYVAQKRSASSIADDNNVTQSAILHWMRKHCIPRRNTSDCRKIKYWRGPLKIRSRNPDWRKPTAEEYREYMHLLELACPDIREQYRQRNREWQTRNKITFRASQKRHYARNADKIRERGRVHDRNRKPQRAVYQRERRKKDQHFRLRGSLSARICSLLRGKNKSASSLSLLGCSIENFKIYLESLWETGMSWENYGRYPGWQIDHIMPCAIFDLTKPEHQRRCFHFSNCRPLWARDNQIKNAKVITAQFGLL